MFAQDLVVAQEIQMGNMSKVVFAWDLVLAQEIRFGIDLRNIHKVVCSRFSRLILLVICITSDIRAFLVIFPTSIASWGCQWWVLKRKLLSS